MALYALGEHTPVVPTESWIAPTATVIGRVQLERDVSIWWGSVLRGDQDLIHVGEATNVQDGAVLHTDAGIELHIGRGVTIGHGAVVHGCTIGENCLIGIRSTLLNRARIGKNCIIGAGALIPEGKEIPDNSLVIGMPGKVARTLTEQEVEKLRLSAAHYVENARRFRRDLRALGG